MHSLETPDTLTVCEPCQHCSVLVASVVLECSCSVPRLRILMCNDPFILLVYMVYQLKYDSVHGRFNGTIAMSEEDREEFFVVKRDRNQGIQLPSAWKPLVPILQTCVWAEPADQRRALSIGFRSVPYYWYAHVHGPWRRTQVLPASRQQHHHDRRGGNDRLHAASAAFDGWPMSHTRQVAQALRKYQRWGKVVFGIISGTLSVLFPLLFSLGLSFPSLFSP